ncbi:hypothetical protein TH53_14950 [Pedobacter lusitanus]|uniref:Uncharacterized protein n=1 Tax=Pedobacter lusitanus TaxID=1503925 RepID=A0A0D0GPL1_9SPHI|nr:hypothetical protein [Pedobacter lusitanus]KIO76436.1 hypothetical protein TH53_14950 [Pedobacter lusitanus]
METKRQIKLNYTQEFKIACKINNLKPEELLQYFISHVSFYAFIGGNMEALYLWATTVCIDFKEVYGGEPQPVTDHKIQEISLKYIKKLTALNMDDGAYKTLEYYNGISIMKEWSAEMLPFTDYELQIQISDESFLDLTFDFNLICRMNGSDIEALLQYFINRISLARERALNLHQHVKTDPSTAFLLLLISKHVSFRNKIMPQQEMYKKFTLQLLKLDEKQEGESNLENKIRNYNVFYLEWYNALNKNVN